MKTLSNIFAAASAAVAGLATLTHYSYGMPEIIQTLTNPLTYHMAFNSPLYAAAMMIPAVIALSTKRSGISKTLATCALGSALVGAMLLGSGAVTLAGAGAMGIYGASVVATGMAAGFNVASELTKNWYLTSQAEKPKPADTSSQKRKFGFLGYLLPR